MLDDGWTSFGSALSLHLGEILGCAASCEFRSMNPDPVRNEEGGGVEISIFLILGYLWPFWWSETRKVLCPGFGLLFVEIESIGDVPEISGDAHVFFQSFVAHDNADKVSWLPLWKVEKERRIFRRPWCFYRRYLTYQCVLELEPIGDAPEISGDAYVFF